MQIDLFFLFFVLFCFSWSESAATVAVRFPSFTLTGRQFYSLFELAKWLTELWLGGYKVLLSFCCKTELPSAKVLQVPKK